MSVALIQRNCFSVRCLQFSSIIFHYTPSCVRYKSSASNNPLLKIKDIPQYRKINGETVLTAIPELIGNVKTEYEKFERRLMKKEKVEWEDVFPVSEKITDRLGLAWHAVQHLTMVKNNPALRDAYQKVEPDVVSLFSLLTQSKPVFNALENLNGSSEVLNEAQNRVINSSLRSARNSGVHLEGDEKEDFNKMIQRLAQLNTKFRNNVLDSTKEFSYVVHDPEEQEGLPNSLKVLMANSYQQEFKTPADSEKGPWKLSLDIPCFQPFMKNSKNVKLREKMYMAYIKRASTGDFDNTGIIEEIRSLRKSKSRSLGFENYAELSLDSKMAKVPSAVWNLIEELKVRAKPAAHNEIEALKGFAASNGHTGELNHWDIPYWSERQREALFNLEEEKLKEYFPVDQVLQGLFKLSKELFGIMVEECAKNTVETWHDDVRVFKVKDENGDHIASFFLDPYSRPEEKQGGAWMDNALDLDEAHNRKPIAYLVCNQSPPMGDTPSLMTFREVETLFHEFGHGLQHMLTTVRYPSAAGVNNVEWDAVELASQFMENWLYDWNTIRSVSSHYQTKETLPKPIFEQIVKGRKYQAGLSTMRQLYLSALDMRLHTTNEHWRDVMLQTAKEYSVIQPLPEDAFPCSFSHIFGGGYAAGYFSYKWAEVLSADAFSVFENAGLENREQMKVLGKRFRDTVLAEGGGRHPEKVFIDFVGRKPNVDALLKSYGI